MGLAVITSESGLRSVPVRDNSPREMFISSFLGFQYPGNVWKRVDRIDKLAHSIGAQVAYGMNTSSCGIDHAGLYYEANGLRQVESVLRQLKRRQRNARNAEPTLAGPSELEAKLS